MTRRTHGAWVMVRGVAFAWSAAAEPLFDEVELQLGEGWYGLVGENGAGKSTLLSILAGERAPTRGQVRVEGTVARVPQVCVEKTAEVEGLAADEGGEARALRRAAGLDPADVGRWASLSAGERRRWLVSGAVWAQPAVLLLDEPETHLDQAGRALLVAALRRHRGLGVMVAHDRDLLDGLTTRTIHVAGGRVRVFEGGVSAALRALEAERGALVRRREALHEEVEARSAQRELARQAARAPGGQTRDRMKGIRDHDARSMAVSNRANWAGAGYASRARKADDALHRAQAALDATRVERVWGGEIDFGFERSGRTWVASLEAAEVAVGERVLLSEVRLFVGREDRIHVAGENGAGKSTLLKRLLASAEPARTVFLPQELSAAEVEGLREAQANLSALERGRCNQVVAALGARPERLAQSGALSPGEAKKLALALGVARGAWLLVLDEPENHLDLASVERLGAALERWPGALVMVTHDGALARRVTTLRWRLAERQVWVE